MNSEISNNQENLDWAKEAYARLKQKQEDQKKEKEKEKYLAKNLEEKSISELFTIDS